MEPDIVIEESEDVEEEGDKQDIKSPDHIHLLPIEKARRRVRLRHSETDVDPTVSEGGSIYSAPSMFSLISLPSEHEGYKEDIKVTMY